MHDVKLQELGNSPWPGPKLNKKKSRSSEDRVKSPHQITRKQIESILKLNLRLHRS